MKRQTSKKWLEAVLTHFDLFLADHASNERKAASTAMDFVVRYPDQIPLVEFASKVAQQEIAHFRQVFKQMKKQNIPLRADEKSKYIGAIVQTIRSSGRERLLDRILFAAVIEMRGQERFEILAREHPDKNWRDFFHDLAESEKDHFGGYLEVALKIFKQEEVYQRWVEVLDLEANIFKSMPETYKLFS